MKMQQTSSTNLVVHCIGSLAVSTGGPAQVVSCLADDLAVQADFRVTLVSQGFVGEPIVGFRETLLERQLGLSNFRVALKVGWPLRKMLRRTIDREIPGLLHDHGIWHSCNHHVATASRRFGIPLLIHTHGMLSPWALRYHGLKKRCALYLYQRRNLKSAALFFVTAEQEARDIRNFGLIQPIAIVPNGIQLPVLNQFYWDRKCSFKAKRNALFMGRIHPVKGILNLLDAWAKINPIGWKLRLAGPDEGGYLHVVMRKIKELRIDNNVEYLGNVDRVQKSDLFAETDLFFLPSLSENFGVVVTEALSYGVPVITTHGTPWESLAQQGCGWWVEATPGGLAEAIQDATSVDIRVLRQKGEIGRKFAQAFASDNVARLTADVYRWALKQGPKPDCVIEE